MTAYVNRDQLVKFLIKEGKIKEEYGLDEIQCGCNSDKECCAKNKCEGCNCVCSHNSWVKAVKQLQTLWIA